MRVTVRLADIDRDLPAIVPHALAFAAASGAGDFLPATADEMEPALDRILRLPGARVFLAEQAGRIVGGIGLFHAAGLWAPDEKTADELFFWIEPDGPPIAALGLLKAAMADMRNEGIAIMSFHALETSPPGVARLYRRLGLRPVQTTFMGRV